MRRTYTWDGEHKSVVKAIIKIFKRDS